MSVEYQGDCDRKTDVRIRLGYILYCLQIPGFIPKIKGFPDFTFKHTNNPNRVNKTFSAMEFD
jgi:hypothetical protein